MAARATRFDKQRGERGAQWLNRRLTGREWAQPATGRAFRFVAARRRGQTICGDMVESGPVGATGAYVAPVTFRVRQDGGDATLLVRMFCGEEVEIPAPSMRPGDVVPTTAKDHGLPTDWDSLHGRTFFTTCSSQSPASS